MITNETLLHPSGGISLGWLDDSMSINGVSEEDKGFVNDTGSTYPEMQAHVKAYQANMQRLKTKVIGLGGFFWQLMKGGVEVHGLTTSKSDVGKCAATLRAWCVPQPPQWLFFQMFKVSRPNSAITSQLSKITYAKSAIQR